MKIYAGVFCIALSMAALTSNAEAQLTSGTASDGSNSIGLTSGGEVKANPGLFDITKKFVRNMKIIRALTPEKEVSTQMDVVIEQADGILKLYSENGAGRKREQLLRQITELNADKNISKRDLEKVDKMKAEIKQLDEDGIFVKSGQYLSAAITELRKLLDQVYTQDKDRNELLRITRMHLDVYEYAYKELMKGS